MDTDKNEKTCIIACAAVQGVLLLLLHCLSLGLDEPARQFWLLWPMYALALWLPPSIQLLAQHCRSAALWRILAYYAAALAAMAAYKGWMVWNPGIAAHDWGGDVAVAGLTGGALWFVLLPFAQLRLQQGAWRPDYPFLFAAAWRNVLQLASAALFTGVLWLLLWLWAGLFALLGVKFFAELFINRFFVYPATSTAFGLGLALYRSRAAMLHGLYGALLQIMGWLLPLAALLALCFLATLPFTGLQPLWKTGHASALLLALQGFLILLFNAAWQDGTGEPLPPRWLRRPLAWAMALLPVYAGLNAYSLSLRIDQYGWSGERVWAALLVFICGFFGIGYAVAALRRSGRWMAGVASVNVAGALLMAALLAATATPLLDPERIGVASQVGRLLSGKVSADAFDYRYLRFDSGRHGAEALKRLAGLMGHPQAETIRRQASALQAQKYRYQSAAQTGWTPETIAALLDVYPSGAVAGPGFMDFLAAKNNGAPWSGTCFQQANARCFLLVIDLDGDGKAEHTLTSNGFRGEVFQRNGETWSWVGEIALVEGIGGDANALKADLAAGKLQTRKAQWRDLEIGARRYRMVR